MQYSAIAHEFFDLNQAFPFFSGLGIQITISMETIYGILKSA